MANTLAFYLTPRLLYHATPFISRRALYLTPRPLMSCPLKLLSLGVHGASLSCWLWYWDSNQIMKFVNKRIVGPVFR